MCNPPLAGQQVPVITTDRFPPLSLVTDDGKHTAAAPVGAVEAQHLSLVFFDIYAV